MATLPETLLRTRLHAEPRRSRRPRAVGATPSVLQPWLRAQSINVMRHAAALRPFRREEFGPGAACHGWEAKEGRKTVVLPGRSQLPNLQLRTALRTANCGFSRQSAILILYSAIRNPEWMVHAP